MKFSFRLMPILLIGIVCLSLIGCIDEARPTTTPIYTPEPTPITLHEPIVINSDSDFIPQNGVTEGSGTSVDPYIIEGWRIDAARANGIIISNTTSSFVIRGVQIMGGAKRYDGIRLTNVKNGRIENSLISKNRFGIYLLNASENIIVNNSIEAGWFPLAEVLSKGIVLEESSRNTIEGNVIVNGSDGISLWRSHTTLIKDNEISGCFDAIYGELSNENQIQHNILRDGANGLRIKGKGNIVQANVVYQNFLPEYPDHPNNGAGIYLLEESGGTVEGNIVFKNRTEGILVQSSQSVLIKGNIVVRNEERGLTVHGGDHVVEGNYVESNGSNPRRLGYEPEQHGGILVYGGPIIVRRNVIVGNSQGIYVFDAGDSIRNYTFYQNDFIQNDIQAYFLGFYRPDIPHPHLQFATEGEGNYWSDYKGKDSNYDGIGDTSYDLWNPVADEGEGNYNHNRLGDVPDHLWNPEGALVDPFPFKEPFNQFQSFSLLFLFNNNNPINGEYFQLTGMIVPQKSTDISLTYSGPNQETTVRTVLSDDTGHFLDTFTPSTSGAWVVEARWPGDNEVSASETRRTFSVTLPPFLSNK